MDIVSGGHSGRFLTEVGSGGHSEHFLTEVGSEGHSGHFLTENCVWFVNTEYLFKTTELFCSV